MRNVGAPHRVSDGGTGATTAAGARSNLGLNSAGAVSFRNRVRNGNFAVNQRAVSGAVTLAASAYGHDGWKAGAGGCTYTFNVAPSGDTVITISAGTLLQIIESVLVPEGGAYILSWAGTSLGRLYQGTATGAYATTPRTDAGLADGTSTTVEFGTGTLGYVQFEPGSGATAFERRGDELQRCQRYLQQVSVGRTYYATIASQVDRIRAALPVVMRATPTVAVTQGTSTSNCSYSFAELTTTYTRVDITGTAVGYCDVYAAVLLSAEL